MIDVICSKCQTKLPVAESKLGTRIFVCPKCATPMEAPVSTLAPPAAIAASEDKTVAPDESQAYVQEKLRQIAEKRAAKAHEPAVAPPLARPVPTRKQSALPLALLVGGGIGVVGLGAVAALVLFLVTRMSAVPEPEKPAATAW